MVWTEWMGEQFNPGPKGRVDFNGQYRAERNHKVVLLKLVIAALFLALGTALAWCIIPMLPLPTFQAALLLLGIALIYISVAYFVHPKPNESNMGCFGGLFDNPFRYSDDINRFLMAMEMFLSPGRYIAEGFVDAMGLVSARREAARASQSEEFETTIEDGAVTIERERSLAELESAPLYGEELAGEMRSHW